MAKRGNKADTTERDFQMLARYVADYSKTQIAKEFEMSLENVKKIAVRDDWDIKKTEVKGEAYLKLKDKYKDLASRCADLFEEGIRRLETDVRKHRKPFTDSQMTTLRLTSQFFRNEVKLDEGQPTQNVNNMGVVKQVFVMPEGSQFPGVFDVTNKVEIQAPTKDIVIENDNMLRLKDIVKELPPPPEVKVGRKPKQEKKPDENA